MSFKCPNLLLEIVQFKSNLIPIVFQFMSNYFPKNSRKTHNCVYLGGRSVLKKHHFILNYHRGSVISALWDIRDSLIPFITRYFHTWEHSRQLGNLENSYIKSYVILQRKRAITYPIIYLE